MKAKAVLTVTLIATVISLITLFYGTAQSKNGHGLLPSRGDEPARPVKRTKPPKVKGTLSDLRVDHVWLDSQCRINFRLRNAGKYAMPDGVLKGGMVRVYFGKSYEDFYLGKVSAKNKLIVDQKGALKKVGKSLAFNTNIVLKERLMVKAYVGRINKIALADKGRGKALPLLPLCKASSGKGEDLGATKPGQGAGFCDVLSSSSAAIIGGPGDDVLVGTSGNDIIYGRGGNDTIKGGGGNDIICGGSGNDSLVGDAGNDTLNGGEGNDTLNGGSGNDRLYGGSGDDRLETNTGHNILSGGDGNDWFSSGDGDDRLYGGDGDDTLNSGWGHDTVYGGNGNDRIWTSKGNDSLVGGSGDDELIAGEGNDTLIGGSGNDSLYGREDDDSLDGGGGNDLLHGGEDNDTLIGGNGNDTLNGDTYWELPGHDICDGGYGSDMMYNCEEASDYVDP